MTCKSEVRLIPSFYSHIMGNARRIFIYLPPSYEVHADKRYAVLYMHAGQRLFEQKKTDVRSWNVHTTVDRLITEQKIQEIIVVGIAHLPIDGTNEFFHDVGQAKQAVGVRCTGKLYERFIIEELKPYIDDNYRTLSGPDDTALMGSSAGALCTYHIGLRRPDIFGKIGILSPYFVHTELKDGQLEEQQLYEPIPGKKNLKIWMDIGTNEGLFFVKYVKGVYDFLIAQGYEKHTELMYYEIPRAAHYEKDWAQRVHLPIQFFFGIDALEKTESIALHGRTQIGLLGAQTRINPVVHFASGMVISDLNGSFAVDHPELLEVQSDGTLIPRALGTTNVTYSYGSMQISQSYTIIPFISETVDMTIEVTVPEHTPKDSIIYAIARLKEVRNNTYTGRFTLPRDAGFEFVITRGFRLFEIDKEDRNVKYRTLIADRDIELQLEVNDWIS